MSVEARDMARDAEVRRYGDVSPIQHELDDLALLATQLCHLPAAAINMIGLSTQATIAAYGVDAGVCATSESMCHTVVQMDGPVCVSDASQDTRWTDNPYVNGERNDFRFYAAHPMVSPRGITFGTVCVFDFVPREVDEGVTTQLADVAARVVDVLELRLRTRELEEVVAQLSETRTELERSNEMLRLFAAQVAHDLRGPISAVTASLELMSERIDAKDEEHAWLIQRSAGSVARMNDLIRDVLNFASVGGGHLDESVDLVELVEELRDDLATDLEGVALSVEELPVVPGDRTQWRVVLQNLISNAVKFNDADEPHVDVSGYVDDDEWVLEVADNGPGVPEDQQVRVFGLMSQGDPSRDGIGLGLATCQRIVAAHGGVVVMRSAQPRGARVVVRVPMQRSREE